MRVSTKKHKAIPSHPRRRARARARNSTLTRMLKWRRSPSPNPRVKARKRRMSMRSQANRRRERKTLRMKSQRRGRTPKRRLRRRQHRGNNRQKLVHSSRLLRHSFSTVAFRLVFTSMLHLHCNLLIRTASTFCSNTISRSRRRSASGMHTYRRMGRLGCDTDPSSQVRSALFHSTRGRFCSLETCPACAA